MIYIGAGHGGGGDRGAVANGSTEWDVCTKVMQKVYEAHPDRVRVIPQRLELRNRINWLQKNLSDQDVYIELHMNAASAKATGTEVFYLDGNISRRNTATGMSNRFSKEIGLVNRGAKPDTKTRFGRLGVIRDVRCQSYLIEMGFLTNTMDKKKVEDTGLYAMEALLELPTTNPANFAVSGWAKPSWDVALRKGEENTVISTKTNPKEKVYSETLEWMFYNMGCMEKKPTGQGLTIERIVTMWDRLKVFDRIQDKL